MSGIALGEGVEENQIEGVTVRIYSPAKTVADCFKYRTKICLDIALEALETTGRSNVPGLAKYGALRGFAAWLG